MRVAVEGHRASQVLLIIMYRMCALLWDHNAHSMLDEKRAEYRPAVFTQNQ